MKSKLKIKPLAIPGMAFFIIFIVTLIIIITHTWDLYNKINIVQLLYINK